MRFWDSPPVSLDGKTIKMAAIITMFIDHVTCCFMEVATVAQGYSLMYAVPYGRQIDSVGRAIGRCAFPVFCFMIVEGFIHTRSRIKYLIRLLVFAAVSYWPFRLIFFPDSTAQHCDTIFTLSIGYLVIWGIDILSRFLLEQEYHPVPDHPLLKESDRVREAGLKLRDMIGRPFAEGQDKGRDIPALVIFLIGTALLLNGGGHVAKILGCDYSYGGVGTVAILYLLYRVRPFSLVTAWIWLTVYNQNELLAITGFWLIWCYNGQRGKQNKYFFYVFYPLHLLMLYLLRRHLFGA